MSKDSQLEHKEKKIKKSKGNKIFSDDEFNNEGENFKKLSDVGNSFQNNK